MCIRDSAWAPQIGQVLAYTLGPRRDALCKKLVTMLDGLPIKVFCTDDWPAYARHLPPEKHLVGKRYTQNIERQNLTFRTRIKRLTRRTICFSKSAQIHDNVIGEFIRQNYFQQV